MLCNAILLHVCQQITNYCRLIVVLLPAVVFPGKYFLLFCFQQRHQRLYTINIVLITSYFVQNRIQVVHDLKQKCRVRVCKEFILYFWMSGMSLLPKFFHLQIYTYLGKGILQLFGPIAISVPFTKTLFKVERTGHVYGYLNLGLGFVEQLLYCLYFRVEIGMDEMKGGHHTCYIRFWCSLGLLCCTRCVIDMNCIISQTSVYNSFVLVPKLLSYLLLVYASMRFNRSDMLGFHIYSTIVQNCNTFLQVWANTFLSQWKHMYVCIAACAAIHVHVFGILCECH